MLVFEQEGAAEEYRLYTDMLFYPFGTRPFVLSEDPLHLALIVVVVVMLVVALFYVFWYSKQRQNPPGLCMYGWA